MLPKKAVIEYQEIYKNKFGIDINFEEAKRKAENFIRLMALITNKAKKENE